MTPTTEAQALAEAKRLVNQRPGIRPTRHAPGQQAKRSVQAADLQSAINTATHASYDAARDTWRLSGGRDTDGDDLDVVLAFDDMGARLVTVI